MFVYIDYIYIYIYRLPGCSLHLYSLLSLTHHVNAMAQKLLDGTQCIFIAANSQSEQESRA